MANEAATEQKVGKGVQISGPVLDVEFEGHLPAIYNALHVQSEQGGLEIDLVAEVAQHLGENRVRAVSMKPTDGLQRGVAVVDLGQPISVPVGPETLGLVMNVLGEPVDFPDKPVGTKERWPIHRPAPPLEDQSPAPAHLGGTWALAAAAGSSKPKKETEYRVLVRGTLHRGELVESSSLHVLPSAFGSTVVLLSEAFG